MLLFTTILCSHILSIAGQDPIYHTLEPGGGDSVAGGGATIEVMLPSGQLVPATLVRNAGTGRIVPLVQVPCDYDDEHRLEVNNGSSRAWNTTTMTTGQRPTAAARRDDNGRGGGLQDSGAERFSTRNRTNRPLGYQYRV
jgi:hypothetical protein